MYYLFVVNELKTCQTNPHLQTSNKAIFIHFNCNFISCQKHFINLFIFVMHFKCFRKALKQKLYFIAFKQSIYKSIYHVFCCLLVNLEILYTCALKYLTVTHKIQQNCFLFFFIILFTIYKFIV